VRKELDALVTACVFSPLTCRQGLRVRSFHQQFAAAGFVGDVAIAKVGPRQATTIEGRQ
jgi:hypothetical protein